MTAASLWPHLWPGWDAVWPNILASIVWAVPGFLFHLHTRRKLRALHDKHDQLHAKVEGLRETS